VDLLLGIVSLSLQDDMDVVKAELSGYLRDFPDLRWRNALNELVTVEELKELNESRLARNTL